MLRVIMLIVVTLNVVAPFCGLTFDFESI